MRQINRNGFQSLCYSMSVNDFVAIKLFDFNIAFDWWPVNSPRQRPSIREEFPLCHHKLAVSSLCTPFKITRAKGQWWLFNTDSVSKRVEYTHSHALVPGIVIVTNAWAIWQLYCKHHFIYLLRFLWFKLLWILFSGDQFTINQHWFK